jgi:hypothetical protein
MRAEGGLPKAPGGARETPAVVGPGTNTVRRAAMRQGEPQGRLHPSRATRREARRNNARVLDSW